MNVYNHLAQKKEDRNHVLHSRQYLFKDKKIEEVVSHKILGAVFDNDLFWLEHIVTVGKES